MSIETKGDTCLVCGRRVGTTTTIVDGRVIPCRICKAEGRSQIYPPPAGLQTATSLQTPAEAASGVAGEEVPAVMGASDPAAGGQDGARSVPQARPTVPYQEKRRFEPAGENPPPPPAAYRPDPPPPPPPPPPPGPDRFTRGFPSWPPPPVPRFPPNVTVREGQLPGAGPLRWLLNLFGRRRRAWALRMEKWQHHHQVVAIDPTGKLPGRVQALEAVAGAARRYLEGPAQPETEEQQVDDLARLLNLVAAVQLLDAVEASERKTLREAMAAQP